MLLLALLLIPVAIAATSYLAPRRKGMEAANLAGFGLVFFIAIALANAERFIESERGKAPGTYTWIPFGGGRRRCLGASFALLEMKIALRAVLTRCELSPVGARPERTRRRSITISPAKGSTVVLSDRVDAGDAPREDRAVAATAA